MRKQQTEMFVVSSKCLRQLLMGARHCRDYRGSRLREEDGDEYNRGVYTY